MTGLLLSCNQNEQTPDEETAFTVTQDSVLVDAAGGTASVSYTVTNPKDGMSVQPDEKADWINDFDTSVTGTLSFTVSENTDTVTRTADVTVVYGDLQDAFKVIQAAAENGDEPDPVAPFSISVSEISTATARLSIIPEDKEATYDYGAVSVADLNTFPDDITFVEDILLPTYRNTAEANNMTLEEMLSIYLTSGDQDNLQVAGLSPETEYYAYAVGLNVSGEITTEFVKTTFTSAALSTLDAEITVEIDGPDATIYVYPGDESELWYPTVFIGQGHDNETMVYSAQSEVESSVIAYGSLLGLQRSDVIQMISCIGNDTIPYTLEPEKEYTAAAFSISSDGYIQSNPVIYNFTTEAVAQSDIEITVEYTSVTGRMAEYTVTPSNEDSYVFFAYQYSDELKAMSDDEIISFVIEDKGGNLNNWVRHGAVSSLSRGLKPLTEYIIYSFGYKAGEATSPLFKSTFTTTESQTNGTRISFEYGPYYNGDEAAEKYPNSLANATGKAVFPVSVVPDGDYWDFYHAIYQGDLTDENLYSDEDLYQDLRTYGYTYWSWQMIYTLDYNQTYTLCGFAETDDGRFGELTRVLVGPFTPDGCSSIDGLNNPSLYAPALSPVKSSPETSSIIPVNISTASVRNSYIGTENSHGNTRTATKAEKSMVMFHGLSE